MSEPTDATLPVGGAETAQDQPEQAAGSDGTSAESAASREAGKYRRQLRSVEAERDALRANLGTLQRRDVERAATFAGLVQPTAVWQAGADLSTLLDAEGNLDPEAVDVAIQNAVSVLGLSVRTPMRPDHSQGARGTAPEQNASWATLLARKD